MALTMDELTGRRLPPGIGNPILAAIGTIIGPLADAGASAYSTYATHDIAKRDAKNAQAELQAAMAQRARETELAAQAKQREEALARENRFLAWEVAKIGLGTLALIGTTVVVVKGVGKLVASRSASRGS